MRKNKSKSLPFQKFLDNDFLRIVPLHEDLNNLSATPHLHDHYEILLFTEGNGDHFINYKKFKAVPNRIYFLQPGQVHLIEPFKRNGWLIIFGDELFSRFAEIQHYESESGLMDSYGSFPYIDLNTEELKWLNPVIQSLQFEISTEYPNNNVLLYQVMALLIKLNTIHSRQHSGTQKEVNVPDEFYRLKKLIEKHQFEQHQVAFYVSSMQMSIKRLNQMCKKSCGLTVAGLLKERLITESKIRLKTSALSIKQISYSLGFNDPAFFGKYFRKHTGFTPAAFREAGINKL